jgi:predicted nuclease of predicted toxin-antitoxin system
VKFHQLEHESDELIWDFAKANGYAIVTKDDGFHQRSLTLGHPPKVLWLKVGNGSRYELRPLKVSSAMPDLSSSPLPMLVSLVY